MVTRAPPQLINTKKDRREVIILKKKDPKAELESLENELWKAYQRWIEIYENGCQDPFWTDGVNLRLVRSHTVYYKRLIQEQCSKFNLPLPDVVTLPVPDEVPMDYMAPHGRYPDRLKRHEPAPEPMKPMQLHLEF